MPLLKGRFLMPSRKLSAPKGDELLYTIPHTGEQFNSKDEYEMYLKLYDWCAWTCQCTGHINLSHAEACKSELETRDAIANKFPAVYHKVVLQVVHHSILTLDALVEAASRLLYEHLVVSEPVTLKIGNRSIHGVVIKMEPCTKVAASPSSDKENDKKGSPLKLLPCKYSIRLREEEKIINGIPSEDLVRELRVPNKDLLKLFIRCYALRAISLPNSPWIVCEAMLAKHDIADILPNATLTAAQDAKLNIKAIDEALRAAAARSKRRKITRGSPIRYGSGKKQMLQKKSNSISDDSDENLSLAELKKTPEKLKPSSSFTKQNDKQKMRQATLFEIKCGKKSKPTMSSWSSPTKSASPRQPPIVARLLKAIKAESSTSLIAQLVSRCANELSDKQRLQLPEHVKSRVEERYKKLREKKMMEKMSAEEREDYLKKKHKEAVRKAMLKLKHRNKKFEDTALTSATLPVPQLVGTPDNLPNELFGDILMLCEFVNCYKALLMPGCKVPLSAAKVMASLEGQADQLGEVISILLQTLLQDTATRGLQELGVALSDIPLTRYTAGELARLCLIAWQSREVGSEEDELVTVPEELLTELEQMDLGQLLPQEKLKILLALLDRLMVSDTVQEYMNERQNDATELWRTRNQLLKEKNGMKREEKQMKKQPDPESTGHVDGDDLASAVKHRRAMLAKVRAEKEQNRARRDKMAQEQRHQKELEYMEKNFHSGILQARLVLRQQPLGTDRHHDRYWLCLYSFPGLLVEKGWAGPHINYSISQHSWESDPDLSSGTGSDSEDNKKGDCKGRCQDITVPRRGQNLWFMYDSTDKLNDLMDALHPKGVREGHLRGELQKNWAALTQALNKKFNTEQTKSNSPEHDTDSISEEDKSCTSKKEEESVDLMTAAHRDLEDLELRLRNGGLGGIDDAWRQRLHKAHTVQELSKCLQEVEASVLDKFIVREEKWQKAVAACATLGRLHLLLALLENAVKWEKSAENAKCKICRKKGEDSLLLCDECNQAFHMHCLRPALYQVPTGDWYCAACAPSSKRRTRATEADNEDCMEVDGEKEQHCAVCMGEKELHWCSTCPSAFHLDCHEPPLRRTPRSSWRCQQCTSGLRLRKSRRTNKRKQYSEDFLEDWEGDSSTEEEEMAQPVSTRPKPESVDTPPTDLQNGVEDELPEDEHSYMKDILGRLRRNRNAWPFQEPVDAVAVPDYYEIVTNPVDLATIKYKLENLHYANVQAFVDDIALLFNNCELYNKPDTLVYKCIAPLEKIFRENLKRLLPLVCYSRGN